ncbi:MAG: nucleotidyltransferase family protein [Alteromonadaceae bacterium]|tara:strand:- start:1778 stop:2419 length:642 start_codon:yes stop_codon:yes gene_type:complete
MSNGQYNLKVILLSAGKSERFKAIKLIAKVKHQSHSIPLIKYVLQQITASLTVLKINKHNLYIATGCYHEQISAVIGQQGTVIYCSNAHLGLGHTIGQSISHVISNDNMTDRASHIMITLADQIALTTDDYIRLIEQSLSSPEKLICAKADIDIMPPAIFPRHYFTQLMNLTGDNGAKVFLHRNKDNLQEIIMSNAAIDIDIKQDLINWHKKN